MPSERTVVLTWRSLYLADAAIRQVLDRGLAADAGCSLLEHDLLAWLTAAPEHRRQMREIADLLNVTRGGLTRIVDRLVERGWVERDRPETNRREVHVSLTASGRQAATHARATYGRLLTETLGKHLDDDELDAMSKITDKLRGAMAGDTSYSTVQQKFEY